MSKDYPIFDQGVQASPQISQLLAAKLHLFLQPLLVTLDKQLDKRLVATFQALIHTIITFRDRANGLLLSELGGYLLSPKQAPAGTKRISNLLRSPKWAYQVIEDFLWQKAAQRVAQLTTQKEPALMLWDESVLEKSESLKGEGLCSVRSSKGARLKHIKPGFYSPPSLPIFVPGLQWVGLVLVGLKRQSGPPLLAMLRWWTSRGERASDKRGEEAELLRECVRRWGSGVIHIWDRGFAGGPWLEQALSRPGQLRFVLRWPKGYKLVGMVPGSGEVTSIPGLLERLTKPAWQHLRGKRSWTSGEIWDNTRKCYRKVGIVAVEVRHAEHLDRPLWLVASRPGVGHEPWYLLTNERVETAAQAWQVMLMYTRRWQIEVSWRYAKSELAFESPRLWEWESRLKLLLIATLAFSFLLSLIRESEEQESGMVGWLLANWCHRTGRRLAEVGLALYRLRMAMSQLWLAHRPRLSLVAPSLAQNSG
jgi:hypothetical protein